MRRLLPISLAFFVITAVVYVLQLFPLTGVFLMILAAPLWSIPLVNAGMIGIAVEAAIGRVWRLWLVVPVIFYAGYWAYSSADRAQMAALTTAYDAANAKVRAPFDPARQAIVFESDGGDGQFLTLRHGLDVTWSVRKGSSEYRSHRLVDPELCKRISDNPALSAAGIFLSYPRDDAAGSGERARLCMVTMRERPTLPIVRVTRQEEKIVVGRLPVTRVTTRIMLPDGRSFATLGGVAAPLARWPMPVMGCALNSGGPSWNCTQGWWRNGFTPIVTGDSRYGRDDAVLARALGLKPVPASARQPGDAALILVKVEAAEADALRAQLASVDAMIADPLAKVIDWQVGVIANRPEVLAGRADAIMTGIERAAAAGVGDNHYKARESGRILAGLIARLPRERFVRFGPQLLAVYATADDRHWLYEAEPLLRRLGDLGVGAVPFLLRPRASGGNVNGAGIEGLCRVGPPAKAAATPMLTASWAKTRDFDRDERRALFVAMKRIGIAVPPLREDKRGQLADIQKDWADISPASPPRVCAVRAEDQARREEKYSGKRRTNID